MKDVFTVLVVLDDEDMLVNTKAVLEEQKNRVVLAVSGHEARLKFANEDFHMVVVSMDTSKVNAKELIDGIRKKEKLRAVKDKIPILVIAKRADAFSAEFSTYDNVKYMESPFSQVDLKKKLLTFGGHSEVISQNSKIIEAGEYLITEGGTSHEMFWILSGSFTITKMNQDEQNVVIGEVFPGELVGEMSFLDNLPRSASVRANETSEVLAIPHRKFIDVLDNQPRWFRTLMRTLSERLRSADSKIVKKMVETEEKE